MSAPCIAVSNEADFEAWTWTFSPVENFAVGAGRYAILRESDYLQIMAALDLTEAYLIKRCRGTKGEGELTVLPIVQAAIARARS